MDIQKIKQIFDDTAYVRMGGTEAELKCAEYLAAQCAEFGCEAKIESFEVDMAQLKEAKLIVDGSEITCKGYFNAGNADLEAPFYYLASTDFYSLSQCKGKIVMIDGYMGYWRYQDLLENGAVGFITYDGHNNYADRDIDQRELRSHVHKGNKIPGVNINAKDAIALVNQQAKTARIILSQEEFKGQSHNVVLDLPGQIDEYIVREVLPYNPDAWVDESKTKIGYEIPFTRIFYEYKQTEPAEKIAKRIEAREQSLRMKLNSLFGEAGE